MHIQSHVESFVRIRSRSEKLTPYTMGLYSKGTATKMDMLAVDGANSGLKATSQYIKERRLVKVPDLLHWDLINLDHLLLNCLPFKIILH